MPSFWSTNWTGRPELHKIVNADNGRMEYFFDEAPQPANIEEWGFDDDHPGLTRTRQQTDENGNPMFLPAGYYSGMDINQVRSEWARQFPGVAFPDLSTATWGAGINAQGNAVPGQYAGHEYTERGNAGHGSWLDQQGGELIGDALFAGAGYAGGPLAGAMMSYGLGGDTSAESQRSLRAGAAGGLVGSIFGTPSTAASNTPSDASGVPADSGTVGSSTGTSTLQGGSGTDTLRTASSTGGNMGYFDDYSGQWVDTGTDAGLYGSNVDEFGNPISSNFQGGNTNDYFNPSAGGAPSLSPSDLKYLNMLKTLFGGGDRAGGNSVFGGASGPGSATGDSSLASLLAALAGGYGLMQGQRGVPQEVQPLLNAGNQTYQTSRDPQGELYSRTAQQVQDQSRAATSARGVGMSPYSAGVENDAMRNFNIDWQNKQLGREVAGVTAMTGATNAAVGAAGFGADQNRGNVNALLSGVSGLQGAYNTPGSWLNTLFNG
jgi:hypothetical protein